MSERTPLLAGNWKMHGTAEETRSLLESLLPMLAGISGRDVLVAPPFTSLAAAADCLQGSAVGLAGQNLHWEERGAYTGEVSGAMLKGAGCSHVIVGHSERRQLFGEDDECVGRKAAAALRATLLPIICVGETLAERDAGATLGVVDRQTRAAIASIAPNAIDAIVLAYEPVWAIGTGRVATPEQAQEVHASLRALLTLLVGTRVAARIRIIYGGSVKPDNVDALMRQPDIDGALVGGASLQSADFARIVRFSA